MMTVASSKAESVKDQLSEYANCCVSCSDGVRGCSGEIVW